MSHGSGHVSFLGNDLIFLIPAESKAESQPDNGRIVIVWEKGCSRLKQTIISAGKSADIIGYIFLLHEVRIKERFFKIFFFLTYIKKYIIAC